MRNGKGGPAVCRAALCMFRGANYLPVSQMCIRDRVYPMCKPVLTTIMVLVFIGGWNDLNGPLLYLQDSTKYTLSIGLQMRCV